MIIIKVDKDLIKTTSDFAKDVFVDYYTSLIGETQARYMADLFLSKEAIEKLINNGAIFKLVKDNNELVGFIEYVKEKDICNNEFTYYSMISRPGTVTNRISSNSRYNYRLELEITNTPLDYSKINIVDNRPSLFSFDSFTIDEDLNIHIDGQAFIYYTNYDVPENVNYKVYLIKDGTEYKELNTTRMTCPLDFNTVINSSYNLSNICFEANDNLSDLQEGKYKMIIEIDKVDGSNTYIDYIEMTNLGDLPMPSNEKDNKTYEVIKSLIRERMELEVKANEQ